MDEGYIKFRCKWDKAEKTDQTFVDALNIWRKKLYDLHLIGQYENGIGFGNISMRYKNNQFIITGTATGGLPVLDHNHYTKVTSCSFSTNTLGCTGPIKASSESLSHAAVYEADQRYGAVIHVHHREMWERMLHLMPTTPENAVFGTPQMAIAIQHILDDVHTKQLKLIVMGGHEEGILTFGRNLQEAGEVLLFWFNQILNSSSLTH